MQYIDVTAAVLAGSLLVISMPAFGGEGPADVSVIDIGSRRQFWFNSQAAIAESSLLHIVQQRPAKHARNPLLVADKPWEGTLVQLYSPDVHYDAKTGDWQMWYEGHPTEVLLCTAFSKDGIRWTKPSLGIQEWKGSKDNNIILQTGYLDAHCASIVKAPAEKDPARRYKLYYWAGPTWFDSQVKAMGLKPDDAAVVAARKKLGAYKANGHYVAFSEDGVHFTPQTGAPVLAVSDFNTVFFNEPSGRYRSYHKIERRKPEWDGLRRCISMAESEDGVHFKPSVPVLDPTPEDDAWAKSLGGRRAEFYGVHVWPHEGFYLGLLWLFRITKTDPVRGMGWDDGYIAPYLIYSADGITWSRMPVREPFIPPGPAGSFEAGGIYSTGDHPVVIGDEVRFYYFGVSYTHGDTEPVNSPKNYSGAGLATLPRDRYAGWSGGTTAGTLRTKRIKFSGRELHLNIDASRGETRVALLDADGKPLPGFGLDDCTALSNDSFDQAVTWRKSSDLSALSGKPVRLEFSLRHSTLYTWQFK